jgi:hypothetical protein
VTGVKDFVDQMPAQIRSQVGAQFKTTNRQLVMRATLRMFNPAGLLRGLKQAYLRNCQDGADQARIHPAPKQKKEGISVNLFKIHSTSTLRVGLGFLRERRISSRSTTVHRGGAGISGQGLVHARDAFRHCCLALLWSPQIVRSLVGSAPVHDECLWTCTNYGVGIRTPHAARNCG